MHFPKTFARVCCGAVTAVMLLTTCAGAEETVEQIKRKIEQANKQKEQAKADIAKGKKIADNINSQQNDIMQKIQDIKNDTKDIQNNLDEIIDNIDERMKAIDENNAQLALEDKKLQVLYSQFKARARSMYEHGPVTYIDVLIGSKDFTDLLSRLTLLRDIIDHDRNLMKEIKDTKAQIEDKKAQNEKKMAELEALKQLKESQKDELQKKLDQNAQLMRSLEQDKIKNQKMIDEAIQKQIEAEKIMDQQNELLRQLTVAQQAKNKRAFSGGVFAWPLSGGGVITCQFGYRTDPYPSYHKGVDISAAYGTPILAANDGVVIKADYGYNGGYGNCVIIDHGGGIATLYGHASKLYVTVGQEVKKGDKIAAEGSTGNSTGPHLHFEVIVNGKNVNPLEYIR